MAEQRIFHCTHCQKSVSAWSDGNPYYIDETGNKKYADHPDHEALSKCIGNDQPHICLDCGHEFKMDSLDPVSQCEQCQGKRLIPIFYLDGQTCPWCRRGACQGMMGGYLMTTNIETIRAWLRCHHYCWL